MYRGYAEWSGPPMSAAFGPWDMRAITATGVVRTHLSVIDGDGMIVSLTSTLLARFGARVRLSDTGLHMNNGISWFDPRPGRPNSLAPGARPLSNMCPLVATRDGEGWFGLGASGGRKIMPAVYQIASFLTDYGMTLSDAVHYPRIEPSELGRVLVDPRLPTEVRAALTPIARSCLGRRWRHRLLRRAHRGDAGRRHMPRRRPAIRPARGRNRGVSEGDHCWAVMRATSCRDRPNPR